MIPLPLLQIHNRFLTRIPFRPEYLNGILPLNPVRVIHILIEKQANQHINKLQILKTYVHDTAELVNNKYLQDTMHKVGAAIKQSYPVSASGKGDAFNGNKNRE